MVAIFGGKVLILKFLTSPACAFGWGIGRARIFLLWNVYYWPYFDHFSCVALIFHAADDTVYKFCKSAFNRGRLLLRTPGPVPYGICKCSFVETTDTRSYITPVYETFPWLDFLPTLTLLLNIGFHRASATGVACRQRTLTPPDTWSCPTLGLACVLMSRPISPELVLSPDFWISNIPRYFSFALKCVK